MKSTECPFYLIKNCQRSKWENRNWKPRSSNVFAKLRLKFVEKKPPCASAKFRKTPFFSPHDRIFFLAKLIVATHLDSRWAELELLILRGGRQRATNLPVSILAEFEELSHFFCLFFFSLFVCVCVGFFFWHALFDAGQPSRSALHQSNLAVILFDSIRCCHSNTKQFLL